MKKPPKGFVGPREKEIAERRDRMFEKAWSGLADKELAYDLHHSASMLALSQFAAHREDEREWIEQHKLINRLKTWWQRTFHK